MRLRATPTGGDASSLDVMYFQYLGSMILGVLMKRARKHKNYTYILYVFSSEPRTARTTRGPGKLMTKARKALGTARDTMQNGASPDIFFSYFSPNGKALAPRERTYVKTQSP